MQRVSRTDHSVVCSVIIFKMILPDGSKEGLGWEMTNGGIRYRVGKAGGRSDPR